jgi:hypothetical protein
MLRRSILFTVWLVFLGGAAALAQEAPEPASPPSVETRTFNRKIWRKATSGLDYTDSKRRRRASSPRENSGTSGSRNGRWVFMVLGALLLGGALFLLWRAIRAYWGLKNPSVQQLEVSLEEIEDRLFESDLSSFIERALAGGQYRMAIRLYFLDILKILALQKQIRWGKDKTNRQYSTELRSTDLSAEFDRLVLIFERVWYGQGQLDRAAFAAIAPDFSAFLRKLQADQNEDHSYG